MARVLLDGKYYEVDGGTIQRRNINPRAARFETGIPGYSSFIQGSAEAWHGLRGGIGHKYQESSGAEECYWSDGLDATHYSGIILGSKVNTAGAFGIAPVKIFDFEGATYATGTSKISKWNTETSEWDSKDTSLASPVDSIVITDSTDSYAIVSSLTAAVFSTNGTTWTTITGPKGYLAVHDNKLYGFAGQVLYNSPAKSSTGDWDIDGTWDSCKYCVYLGTPYRMFSARSQNADEPILCLCTTIGMFTIDSWVQEMYKLIPLFGHTNGGHAGMFWNTYIYFSTLGGIKKNSPGTVTDVGPDQDDGLPAGYQGYVSDMIGAGDGSWMFFAVNGGSTDKSSIFKRHGTIGGIQQIYTTAAVNNPITCLHYSPSSMYTNGRLWWGEGTDIKYCMMPDVNADVREIGSYEFVTSSGKLVHSIFRPLESINKTAIRIRATTNGCDDNKKFTVYYRTNENTATAIGLNWTTLGTLTESPTPTALDFGSGAGIEFKSIQLAIDAATDSATVTPELRSLELDYDVGTKRLRGWTFNVKVTQHDADEIVDNLHTSQDKDTMLLFYPSSETNRDSYRVKIENIAENVEWGMFRRNGIVQVAVGELIRG